MNDAVSPTPDAILDNLTMLCAQPSVSGQARALADGADGVASILRDVGLQCRIIKTGGAPVVLGRYDAGVSRTVLLYGRYDVPPAGLRRNWTHDPFQPTVHDGALYARGAVVKAELVARAEALRTMITQHIPLNIVVVVEGESLIGSPNLGSVQDAVGNCAMSLWSGGGFDSSDVPLLYTGVKGLLQVELRTTSAVVVVPLTYAATVPNPAWTLALALTSIKSEFEEILIEGFYDEITPPSRQQLNTVQGLDVGEQARRTAWGVKDFVAGVKGAMLTRTETFSPTCNISALNLTGTSIASIPQSASAELQFQLVPDLDPARVFELLTAHLQTRGYDDVQATQLPGTYRLVQSAALPFDAAQTTVSTYGQPARVLPFAPFAAPAALLAPAAPLISCGLERPSSALFAADEHVSLADVTQHTRFITELLRTIAV